MVLQRYTCTHTLTKLLWQVEKWFWFAHFLVTGSPQRDKHLHGTIDRKVVERRRLEHDGVLVCVCVRTC